MSKAIYLILPLLVIGINLQAQFFKKGINRFDEEGLRTGLWKTYWDDDEKIPMSIGKFEKGRETGVCKEYHYNGKLRLKSRYHNNKIRMKYYGENRKLISKGWAIIDYESEDIHFYWHGKWKFFSESRHLVKISIYENGNESLGIIK